MAKKSPHWTYTAGSYPYTVTVTQASRGALIYARWWDRELRAGRGNWTRPSLRHRDRRKAEKWADDKSLGLKWKAAELAATADRPTLGSVLALYLKHATPEKSPRVQADDHRRAEMYERVFGPELQFDDITPEHWRDFRDERLSGKIDARGRPRAERPAGAEDVPIRPRAARADLSALRTIARWAVGWKVPVPGSPRPRPILASNPLEGASYPLPEDKNPRQPVITHTAHGRLLRTSRGVSPILPDLLVLANGTGRRISAILQLRACDFRPEKTSDEPQGAIVWPEDTDKQRKEWRCPIDAEVRKTMRRIIRERGIAGEMYLFRSPRRSKRPPSRDHARKLLVRCYTAAGVEKTDGSAWHVYRRKFVTERPHMSDALVGRLAGMSEQTVRLYRQDHPAGLYEALTSPRRLLEVSR